MGGPSVRQPLFETSDNMEKADKLFPKRDSSDPDRILYVSAKGRVAWDLAVDKLPTVEDKTIGKGAEKVSVREGVSQRRRHSEKLSSKKAFLDWRCHSILIFLDDFLLHFRQDSVRDKRDLFMEQRAPVPRTN